MLLETSSTHRSLRSSLYPFIRNQTYLNVQKTAPQKHQASIKKHQNNFLERYHDQSLIVLQNKSNRVSRYAKALNKVSLLLRTNKNKPKEMEKDSKRAEQNWTFNPQSNFLYAWNVLIALSILYHFFEIPICLFFTQQAYQSEFNGGFGISCNVISLIVLFVNMAYVIPNTQYYHNGFLVTKQQKIIKRYVGWRLFLDVLSFISLFAFLVSQTYSLIYLKVIFYLMGYRLYQVDDCLQRKIELAKIWLASYKLFRIILLLMFLVLWLGSIFFAIDYYYYQQGPDATYTGTQLWLTDSLATNSINLVQFYNNWVVWLDYAVYWSFATVSMVGFGDITGKNPVEVTFSSLVITLVVISYAFFITGVWEIIAEARQFTHYQQKQWKVYKEYQKENMKPLDRKNQFSEKGIRYRELKNKVGSFLFQMWNNQKTYSQINILQVLEKSLTPELKDQIFINYRKQLFQRIDLFQSLQELQSQSYKYIFRQLIFKITEKKYAKQDVVINAGQISSNLIYLVNGKLQLIYPNSQYQKTFLHNFSESKNAKSQIDKNSNFSVKQFFTQQRVPYSVISKSFCKTSELSLQNFLKCIKSVQDFYVPFFLSKTKFCELRDQIKLYGKDFLTGELCIECRSNQHDLGKCEKSDIVMFQNRLRMGIGQRRQDKQKESKGKNSKISFRRKNIRSVKVINKVWKRSKQVQIQASKNFTLYYPEYNLSKV